jgi:glycosyltransferase involved in cell wall biosynthesis
VSVREPNISVVMPVFNGARFVASAIESIQNQTLEDFEFIIVDDGSTDATSEILTFYAGRDRRIRVLRQDNTGVVGALNRGIEVARAPLLARMDADDLSRPGRFEAQSQFLADDPDCTVVGSAVRLIDAQGSGDRIILHPRRLADLGEAVGAGRILAHPTALMRLEAVRKVGGYRPAFQGVEDTDLWLRLVSLGPIGNLEEVLLDYRMHPDKVTQASTRLTRVKESVARGLAWERFRGLAESRVEGESILERALDFASQAVADPGSSRNPWMDSRRTRRILRDILKLDPALESACRDWLARLALGQVRRLELVEAAKSFFYRYRWN